jgi:hypothetical protein
MKKNVIASILGISATLALVNLSHGQGFVIFENYDFGGPLNAPVTFATAGLNGATLVTAGEAVGPTFNAVLLYAIGAAPTFTTLTQGNAAAGGAYPTAFSGLADGDTANGAGFFLGPTVTIPGYSSGPITFEVEAFNGATYGAAGSWSGTSSSFTLSSLSAGNPAPPAGDFGAAMQPFTVSFVSVPEPTTLALAGLGGLASLVMLRRKTA